MLLVIGAIGVLPSFLEALRELPFEGKLTIGDFVMAMVTVAIAVFAGIQIILQWNQHIFDRNVQRTNYKLSLFEARASILMRIEEILLDYVSGENDERPNTELITALTKYLLTNQHYLPNDQRKYVRLMMKNILTYRRAFDRLERLEREAQDRTNSNERLNTQRASSTAQLKKSKLWLLDEYIMNHPQKMFAPILELPASL